MSSGIEIDDAGALLRREQADGEWENIARTLRMQFAIAVVILNFASIKAQ